MHWVRRRNYVAALRSKLISRSPSENRTRKQSEFVKLQLTGVDFENYEVDLENKSEEFLGVNPTGKVPVVVADGDSLFTSLTSSTSTLMRSWRSRSSCPKIPRSGPTPASGWSRPMTTSSRPCSSRASAASEGSPRSRSPRPWRGSRGHSPRSRSA